MARRSRVGDFKLRRVLRTLHKNVDNEVRPAMQVAADIVLQKQRELIPVDTGAGRDALTAFVSKSGLDAQIGIRGIRNAERFFYLRFVEYGTKGYSGSMYQKSDGRTKNRDTTLLKGKRNALRRRAVENKSDGSHFFGYYPDIPARPAHPFIRPSYSLNRDEIVGLIRAAISSTLAKAAGGGSP